MQEAFEHLYVTIYTQHNVDKAKRDAHVTLSSLIAFNNRLLKKSQHERLVFKMKNDALIRQTRQYIIEMYKGHTKIIRELHEMFDEHLQYNPTDLKMRCTEIFEQFIRGITVFHKDDDNSVPIYHRNKSCGSKTLSRSDYRSTRTCTLEHSVEELKKNKANIYYCYLERKVYDALFSHYYGFLLTSDIMSNSKQNDGHRKKLEETKEYFHTCYPNMEIYVEIDYDDTIDVPIKLLVHKRTRRLDQQVVSEEYTRTINRSRDITTYSDIYEDPVVLKETRPSGLVRYKVTTYMRPSKRYIKYESMINDK